MAIICLPPIPPALLISSIANSVESTTLFSEIAIVPLRECKIPTLIPSPAADAAGEASPEAAGEASVVVEVVVGLPQAFSKMLVPNVAEPYRRNLRRLIRVLILASLSEEG